MRLGAEANLIPKTCISCALFYISSLITYIAVTHGLDPFIPRCPVCHVHGLLGLALAAWLLWVCDFRLFPAAEAS